MRTDGVVSIGLLGCGTVGSQVVRMLTEHGADWTARSGARLQLSGIAVRDVSAERPPWVPRDLLTEDAEAVIDGADIVVELIGGIEPARTYMRRALQAGGTVVTGNKALLAAHGPELHDAVEAGNGNLYYEAAVAGAIPVVYGLRESLAGDKITSVAGVVNGTTNYILDEMTTKGLGFEEALAAAQELGYAEADPTADVDGHDAAAKGAILASLAFHTRVSIDDVPTTGIRDITAADIAAARADGHVLKLLAVAQRTEGGVSVQVRPTLVPLAHPLAAVRGAFNAVVVEAEAAGRLMFYGQGAGGAPTASAVLSDIVAAAGHVVRGSKAPRESAYAALPLLGPEHVPARAQVTVRLADEPGTLSTVTGIFGAEGVSIEAVRQPRVADAPDVHLIITTHTTTEAALQRTLAGLEAEPKVDSVLSVTAVEGQ